MSKLFVNTRNGWVGVQPLVHVLVVITPLAVGMTRASCKSLSCSLGPLQVRARGAKCVRQVPSNGGACSKLRHLALDDGMRWRVHCSESHVVMGGTPLCEQVLCNGELGAVTLTRRVRSSRRERVSECSLAQVIGSRLHEDVERAWGMGLLH